jgi:hypothetical protein
MSTIRNISFGLLALSTVITLSGTPAVRIVLSSGNNVFGFLLMSQLPLANFSF